MMAWFAMILLFVMGMGLVGGLQVRTKAPGMGAAAVAAWALAVAAVAWAAVALALGYTGAL